jgi:hypothetical protein
LTDPRILQAFFRFGLLIGLGGLLLVLLQPRDTAEYYISICTAMIGGVMIAMVVILARIGR